MHISSFKPSRMSVPLPAALNPPLLSPPPLDPPLLWTRSNWAEPPARLPSLHRFENFLLLRLCCSTHLTSSALTSPLLERHSIHPAVPISPCQVNSLVPFASNDSAWYGRAVRYCPFGLSLVVWSNVYCLPTSATDTLWRRSLLHTSRPATLHPPVEHFSEPASRSSSLLIAPRGRDILGQLCAIYTIFRHPALQASETLPPAWLTREPRVAACPQPLYC